MAEKRMFSKKIIHSDEFMDMPISTQNLYFYLLLEGDDDGFVNSPKRIQRTIGASDDDAKILLMKKFIIAFDTGVIVIKHWRMHNYIRKDRYKPTAYTDEMSKLSVLDNGSYELSTNCQPLGIPTGSIKENSIEENRVTENKKPSAQKKFTFALNKETSIDNLSDEYLKELKKFIENSEYSMTFDDFVESCEMKGYKYKNFKAAYNSWNRKNKSSAVKKKGRARQC